jgi:hypothetical protein
MRTAKKAVRASHRDIIWLGAWLRGNLASLLRFALGSLAFVIVVSIFNEPRVLLANLALLHQYLLLVMGLIISYIALFLALDETEELSRRSLISKSIEVWLVLLIVSSLLSWAFLWVIGIIDRSLLFFDSVYGVVAGLVGAGFRKVTAEYLHERIERLIRKGQA